MCNLMGGASSEQKGLERRDSDLGLSLKSNYDTAFAHDQNALDRLSGEVQRIQSGDTGRGFGAEEESARLGLINASAGAEARNVEQATANMGAGQNFGNDDSGITSGIRQQLNEEAVSGAERDKSLAILQNKAENYHQGRLNAAQTVGGFEALSGAYQHEGSTALGGAENANAAAADQENKIQAQSASGGLFGGLLSAGIGVAGKLIKPRI